MRRYFTLRELNAHSIVAAYRSIPPPRPLDGVNIKARITVTSLQCILCIMLSLVEKRESRLYEAPSLGRAARLRAANQDGSSPPKVRTLYASHAAHRQ
jgi:hypothetical protein